ncbi:hypothetical protein HHK36_013105 [Tetracentron sinense]|uniref:Uncharacterized protein n=1 Tax=Tetracentron sinense TaxID=13715 RepID=A0A835DF38_TETSI|nr:hypothetical protein HHK36_013105 [Tetracentron sinense]
MMSIVEVLKAQLIELGSNMNKQNEEWTSWKNLLQNLKIAKGITEVIVPEFKSYSGARDAKELRNFLRKTKCTSKHLILEDKKEQVHIAVNHLSENAMLRWRQSLDNIMKGLCNIQNLKAIQMQYSHLNSGPILEEGKSTVIGLIYDYIEDAKNFEPKYRLIRNGLDTKVEKSRKQTKERKNEIKKIRGVKKTKTGNAAKGRKKK